MSKSRIKKIAAIIFLVVIALLLLTTPQILKSKIHKSESTHIKSNIKTNNLILGKILYHTRGCTQCHGDTGMGNGRRSFKKKMRVKPLPFKKTENYKNKLTQEGIKKTLLEGIKTDGVYYMPRYWYLQEEDMKALAEYVIFLSQQLQ